MAPLVEDMRSGMTQYEAATKYDLTREYIRRICRENGIEAIHINESKILDKDLMIQEHHINKMTFKEIAEKYGRTVPAIKNMFKKLGIRGADYSKERNQRRREELFKSIDLNVEYGKLTKIELQKKYHIGQQTLDTALENSGIERKYFNRSSYEKELLEFLTNNNITNIKTNDRNAISPKELDLYLPDYNLAIEINGLYWHAQIPNKQVDKNVHYDKFIACKNKNIKLLQFFEDEWLDKKEICKSIILQNLGKNKKLFARKTTIQKIDSSVARQFCEENHIQGHANASFYYGCFHEDELISVMTFGKSRFESSEDTYELIRYCSKKYISIVGGASKLFKAFLSEHHNKNILSYADCRISIGKLYEILGFEYVHTTEPGYSYVIGKKRSNRMNWQKHKLKDKLPLFDENLSEQENMTMNKFYRIYDAGQMLWKYGKVNIHIDPTTTIDTIIPVQCGSHNQKNKKERLKKFNISEEEIKKLYFIENKTQQQIADELGCNKCTVVEIFKRYNIKGVCSKNKLAGPLRKKEPDPLIHTKEWLENEYHTMCKSQRQIAKETGIAKHKIQQLFKKFNITVRPPINTKFTSEN